MRACSIQHLVFLSTLAVEMTIAFTATRQSSYFRKDSFVLSKEQTVISTTLFGSGGLFGEESRRDPESKFSSYKKEGAVKKSARFATGDELKRLRSDLDSLRENLRWAEAMADQDRIDDLSKAVQNGENRDPDVIYRKAKRAVIDAKASYFLPEEEKARRVKLAEKEAAESRKYIARFQLEGLWLGNYGDHQQLVNVSYSGDTMIATKVTGDATVPRGKVSFTAELSPTNASSLEPLRVSFDDEKTQLLRYPGKGQVAQTNFINSKYVEGQLVMFDKHFSFVWIPTRHHVLFRRPTPEQTIHLLRDVIAQEDELENMRSHVARCFDMDMTESLARFHANQGKEEPLRRISLTSELEVQMPFLESKEGSRFNFWNVNKWREYIDRVLGDNEKKK